MEESKGMDKYRLYRSPSISNVFDGSWKVCSNDNDNRICRPDQAEPEIARMYWERSNRWASWICHWQRSVARILEPVHYGKRPAGGRDWSVQSSMSMVIDRRVDLLRSRGMPRRTSRVLVCIDRFCPIYHASPSLDSRYAEERSSRAHVHRLNIHRRFSYRLRVAVEHRQAELSANHSRYHTRRWSLSIDSVESVQWSDTTVPDDQNGSRTGIVRRWMSDCHCLRKTNSRFDPELSAASIEKVDYYECSKWFDDHRTDTRWCNDWERRAKFNHQSNEWTRLIILKGYSYLIDVYSWYFDTFFYGQNDLMFSNHWTNVLRLVSPMEISKGQIRFAHLRDESPIYLMLR